MVDDWQATDAEGAKATITLAPTTARYIYKHHSLY